ncbi:MULTISPECIES: hypothetical protein [Bacillus]|uniref:Endo-alpha-1,4-polygalactosaminidase (GH114 family) n=1 Tax=Bacillus capparidis TaxID=1840411 RepID=A0ABS4CY60_9BACI|nr:MULTISPECIES: hypothetical protein [Bacillus]MBP1082299.1 endo-alpha-1,4-polygalactosaminidase (GH114 family) [Bacillus capparidis]MED1097438.1 hypothetical protein [Bacillus capparidis]
MNEASIRTTIFEDTYIVEIRKESFDYLVVKAEKEAKLREKATKLRKKNERLKKALSFYSDCDDYFGHGEADILKDRGK